MKKIIDNSNTQVVISIQIDKHLNAYTNKVLFPKKVENAHAFIDKFGLPPKVLTDLARPKSEHLTSLQKALLRFYAIEPTEEQMAQINNFISHLLMPSKALELKL